MCQLGNYFNDFVSKLNPVGQTKGENTKRMNKNVQFGSERMWGRGFYYFEPDLYLWVQKSLTHTHLWV